MKFSFKMVFSTCLIIAVCFSVGGIFMIQRNFHVAYDNAVENYSKQHIVNRYSLESNIRSAMESGKEFSDSLVNEYADKMTNYGNEQKELIIENSQGKTVFSSIKNIDKKIKSYEQKKEGYYEIYETEGKTYFLIGSKINISGQTITVINRFDMSDTFRERKRQTSTFIFIDIGIILIAFILVGILSLFLTKDIKKLSETSSMIASGKYHMRTKIKSNDEIGELSKNFDIMADSVEEHIEKLQSDVEAREQFVSDFSHELKTPMTSMMGYSKMLLSNNLEEEERIKAEEYIYRECRRLKRLSKTLLKMLGISEETIEEKWIYTELIAEALEKVSKENMEYSKLEIDMEEGQVLADTDLMITLVRNLVENGDKACRDTIQGTVKVLGRVCKETSQEGNNQYCITVTDNGCGMAEEEISKVTRPFYMVDKARARSTGGSGMGLNICQKICTVSGIQMSIKSKVHQGTEVQLMIPNYRESVEDFEEKGNGINEEMEEETN